MAVEKKNIANFNGKIFQPMVIYNDEIRVLFHKENIAYPFHCTEVFFSPDEAQKYLGTFIRRLIKNGDMPEDALIGDKVNEHKLVCSIVELSLSAFDDNEEGK